MLRTHWNNLTLRRKRLALSIGGLAVLLLVLWLVPLLLVDTDRARAALSEALTHHIGHQTHVENATAFLLPLPHITFSGITLDNIPKASAQHFLKAKRIKAGVDIISLFSGTPQIRTLEIINPQLELEVLEDGTANWLRAPEQTSDSNIQEADVQLPLRSLTITEGEIRYASRKSRKTFDITGVELEADIGTDGSMQAQGQATAWGKSLNLGAIVKASAVNEPRDISFTVSHEQTSLTFQGKFNRLLNNPHYAGTLAFNSSNLMPWLVDWGYVAPESITIVSEENGENAENTTPPAIQKPPLPFSFNMELIRDGLRVAIPSFTVQGLNSTATGTAQMVLGDITDVTLDTQMEVLDVGRLVEQFSKPPAPEAPLEDEDKKKTAADALQAFKEDQNKDIGSVFDEEKKKIEAQIGIAIPKDMIAKLAFNIKKVAWGKRTFTDFTLQGDMIDGEIIFSQINGQLAADTQMIANGIVKQTEQGISFEGNVEAQGDNFRALMGDLTEARFDLPPKDYGPFRFRANLYHSPEEARFSEIRLQVENARLSGAVIFYFENKLRVVSAIGAKTIDFDNIISHWSEEKNPVAAGEEAEDPVNEFDFSWLKNLRSDITLRARVDDFTFKKRHGDTISGEGKLKRNEMKANEVAARYDNKDISGGFTLSSKAEFPFLDINMRVSELDTSDLIVNYGMKENSAAQASDTQKSVPTRWSERHLEYPYFNDFTGNLRLAIGKFIHRGVVFDQVEATGSLQDAILNLNSISAAIWDGKLQASGSLSGGTVPGFSASFNFNHVDLTKVVQTFTPITNLTGIVTITGSIGASGLHYHNWVQSSTGSIGITGTNTGINGFDLATIVRAVAGVRTVADIVNITRLALPGGRTEFSSMGGNIVVEAGIATSPGIRLQSELTQGLISGTANLIDWLVDGMVVFELITVDEKDPPKLTLKVKGNLDSPTATMDSRSLEAYVARVAAERMLKKPGAKPVIMPDQQ